MSKIDFKYQEYKNTGQNTSKLFTYKHVQIDNP